MAGGGVRAGSTYGATDELAMKVVENKVALHDLHATILHQMGFDHKRLTYRYSSREFRLTDVHGRIINSNSRWVRECRKTLIFWYLLS